MNKVCGNKQHPPVIISKFLSSRHNVSSKRVILENHPSILDVLTFDNDVVFNTFIDQVSYLIFFSIFFILLLLLLKSFFSLRRRG